MGNSENTTERLYNPIDINNFVDFTKATIKSMLLHIERLPIDKNYWKQTVVINTGNVCSVDFNTPKKILEDLANTGYIETIIFLNL